MYSVYFTIYPLLQKRFGLIKCPIFLSPSGMLKDSALQQKALKKYCYLKAFRLFKIHKIVTFHANDESEKKEIVKVFGESTVIKQVYNAPPVAEESIDLPSKKMGMVKIVFSGRVHPTKNLHFFLKCLLKIKQTVELTIIGPIEDKMYFEQCRKIKDVLPANISVAFLGGISAERINSCLKESHFLALPSLGENFGYAIIEALFAGRPVIISDQTPWRNMEAQRAGWDISLYDPDAYVTALEKAADMQQEEYNEWATAAWKFARQSIPRSTSREKYITMFDHF